MTASTSFSLACVALMAAAALYPASVIAATDSAASAEAAVLQTDGEAAKRLYSGLLAASDKLSTWERRQARCSLARLGGEPSVPRATVSGDSLADKIITIYRDYWVDAINPSARPKAEDRLFRRLARTTGQNDATNRDAVLIAVAEQLNARNIYTSQGKTAALYDLLLYLREEERLEVVELNDGTTHEVKVFLMHNMISHGWARFFTCGGRGTGGFAVENGLYAVAETYNLEGEDFLINFLLHETRHFADYKRFPGLAGPELEYRAKLSELSKADKTLHETLKLFESDQSDDRNNPHSYANKRVLSALRDELTLPLDADLKQVQPDALRAAAISILLQDNAAREQLAERN